MEPKLPTPNGGLEMPSVDYGKNLEQTPSVYQPERAIEQSRERGGEQMPAGQGPALPPVVVPEPVIPVGQPQVDDVATAGVVTDAPMVAADEDLIEKEWVDRAKKIITDTKDDPYLREQEMGKLQRDYLQKRYGKELGASS